MKWIYTRETIAFTAKTMSYVITNNLHTLTNDNAVRWKHMENYCVEMENAIIMENNCVGYIDLIDDVVGTYDKTEDDFKLQVGNHMEDAERVRFITMMEDAVREYYEKNELEFDTWTVGNVGNLYGMWCRAIVDDIIFDVEEV